jgi:hypothetical protein
MNNSVIRNLNPTCCWTRPHFGPVLGAIHAQGAVEALMHWSVVYTWHQERHFAGQYDSLEEAEHWAQHMRDHEWHAWIERVGLNG